MNARIVFALLVLPFLAPIASADPGDVDAADTPELAATTSLTLIGGTIGPGDAADHYRIDAPAGMLVRATFNVSNTTEHLHGSVRSGNGSDWNDVHLFTCANCTSSQSASAYRDGPAVVGIHGIDGSLNTTVAYTIHISFQTVVDLAIRDVQVTPVANLQTDEKDVYLGNKRDIAVTLGSDAGAGAAYVDIAITSLTDGATTYLPGGYVYFGGPGGEAVLTTRWDTGGTVGDVQIRVGLFTFQPDSDYSDNTRYVRTYAIAGGTGLGVTLGDLPSGTILYRCERQSNVNATACAYIWSSENYGFAYLIVQTPTQTRAAMVVRSGSDAQLYLCEERPGGWLECRPTLP